MIEKVDKDDIKRAKVNSLRRYLPYGVYICADGREVIFNRNYRPIFERKDGIVKPANQNEWVEFTDQKWFYNDATAPFSLYGPGSSKTMKKCLQILKVLNVFDYDHSDLVSTREGHKSTVPLLPYFI